MEGLELIAFNIIGAVGTAKSHVMEAMTLSREGKFTEAEQKIQEANEMLKTGEKEHFTVITQEAKDNNTALTLLYIHAEDQLMTTVCLRDTALELIETNRALHQLTKKVEALEGK